MIERKRKGASEKRSIASQGGSSITIQSDKSLSSTFLFCSL